MENNPDKKLPFYVRLSLSLLTIVLILSILILGKTIFVPLFFAGLLTIVLIGPSTYLEKKHLSRTFSAAISLIAGLIIGFFVLYFITTQIANFKDELPNLKTQLTQGITKGEQMLRERFHIRHQTMEENINKLQESIVSSSSGMVGTTVSTVGTGILYLILIPIYTFLMLLYRTQVVQFLETAFGQQYEPQVHAILHKVRYVIKSYIIGLLIEMLAVAILGCTGLLIAGAKYAILFGCIAAILNLIPYLGIFTAMAITFLITLATNDPTTAFICLAILIVIHLIDSNVLLPKIVGSKVQINALVTIVAVIIGEAIWGIPGMFLSIPVTAIFKVIFDNVDHLRPWSYLIGVTDAKNKKRKHS